MTKRFVCSESFVSSEVTSAQRRRRVVEKLSYLLHARVITASAATAEGNSTLAAKPPSLRHIRDMDVTELPWRCHKLAELSPPSFDR